MDWRARYRVASATRAAVRNDLLVHIVELKGQLDSYAAGNYTKAASQYHAAHNHMFMTGDLAAGAIAKQKGAQVTSSVDPHGATVLRFLASVSRT
jgi:hypothetical protein